ncbi:hypothetical protein ENHY17A_200237 [Moraxellaceae bacterium 17A]|nr:hypothetical protein ENHY17A_200237 [Moraxellaceae bacterium 17A]
MVNVYLSKSGMALSKTALIDNFLYYRNNKYIKGRLGCFLLLNLPFLP